MIFARQKSQHAQFGSLEEMYDSGEKHVRNVAVQPATYNIAVRPR